MNNFKGKTKTVKEMVAVNYVARIRLVFWLFYELSLNTFAKTKKI